MIALTTALLGHLLLWTVVWHRRVRIWTRRAPVSEAGGSVPEEGRISVIIPARNEGRCIDALLTALGAAGPSDMEILVVDDASTDDTAARVREHARTDPRVRLLSPPHKPEDWGGKPWALAQGARAAHGDWLLFCDADIVPHRGFLAYALGRADAERLDGLSLAPRMRGGNLAVDLLLACFALSRALLFRPAAPGRPGLLQGACLLMRRCVYERVSGFGRVRGSLLEDVEFGHLLGREGVRFRMLPAQDWVATEMYEHIAEAADGLRRICFAVLGFSLRRVAGMLGLYVLLFVVPTAAPPLLLGVCRGGYAEAWPALAASGALLLAMFTVSLHVVRRERMPVLAAVLMPFAFLAFIVIGLQSVAGYRSGHIRWKDRLYRGASWSSC